MNIVKLFPYHKFNALSLAVPSVHLLLLACAWCGGAQHIHCFCSYIQLLLCNMVISFMMKANANCESAVLLTLLANVPLDDRHIKAERFFF